MESIPALSLRRRIGLPETVYLASVERYLLLSFLGVCTRLSRLMRGWIC